MGIAGVMEGKWLRLESEHFEMLSELGERDSKDMLVELEQFRGAFLSYFRLSKAHEPRASVVVFKNRSNFEPYCPLYEGQPKHVGGYCIATKAKVSIALSGDAVWDSFGTVFHEYVHALITPRAPGIPAWISEGLADLFSSVEIRKDEVRYGDVNERRGKVLRRNDWLPMDVFLRVDRHSPHYNQHGLVSVFYAQSWVFMHYLVCSEESGKFEIGKLLGVMRDGKLTPEEALLKATGVSAEELKKRVEKYMKGGKYFARVVKVPAKPIREGIKVRVATKEETEFALLNLRWKVRKEAKEAMKKVEQWIAKRPEEVRLYELMGELCYAQKDRERGVEFFKKAVEKGSEDPFVHLSVVREVTGKLRFNPDCRLPAEESERLRGLLDRVIELAPETMDAYELLIEVEAYSEKPRTAAVAKVMREFDHLGSYKSRGVVMLFFSVILWRYEKYEECLNYLKAVEQLRDDPAPAGRKSVVELVKVDARKFAKRVEEERGRRGAAGENLPEKKNPASG